MAQILNLHGPLTVGEHGVFVLAGLLIYLFSTRLTHQHRHPSAALAWVLIIVLLPYLGVPLYLLFGVRKVPRPQSRRRQLLQRTETADGQQHWAWALGEALALPSPTRNEGVQFQSEGHVALEHLHTLIGQARRHIDLCTFLVGHDAVAQQLVEALCAAAGRGVRVRVLLDQVGCLRMPRRLLTALRRGGVRVQFFMPVLSNIRRGRINLRNHRKLLIVDGETVWSGGRNLACEYFVGQHGKDPWNDISFTVSGPAARQALELFEHDWQMASGERGFADPPVQAHAGPPDGRLLQWVPSGPDHAEDTLYALLLAAAYRAERRIVLVSPYFVPDDALLSAWSMACRRGVRLTLVIPDRSNHRLADLARAPALRALAAAGADIRLYPRMLHAKAAIVDDEVAWCGSANLDSRSLFLNFELTTAFYDPEAIGWLGQWAQRLAQEGRAAPVRPASVGREVLEGLVRIVGFQL